MRVQVEVTEFFEPLFVKELILKNLGLSSIYLNKENLKSALDCTCSSASCLDQSESFNEQASMKLLRGSSSQKILNLKFLNPIFEINVKSAVCVKKLMCSCQCFFLSSKDLPSWNSLTCFSSGTSMYKTVVCDINSLSSDSTCLGNGTCSNTLLQTIRS